MRVENLLLAAGQRTPFAIPGRFFLLITAPAAIDVEFRRNRSLLRERAQGVVAGYKTFPGNWSDPDDNTFDEFVLTSAAAQTVTVGVSESAGDYSFLLALVDIRQPTNIVTTADATVGVAVADIIAENTSRKTLILRALKANTGTIRFGETGIVAANRGGYLDAGDVAVLDTTATIRGIATAAGQLVSITELTV